MSNFLTSSYRYTLTALPILALGLLAGYTIAWWTIAPIAFLVTAFKKEVTPLHGFTASFAAGFFLWYTYAGFLNFANQGIMAGRIGSMLAGGNSAVPTALILSATGLIGGLIAGLGGLSGVYGRQLRNKN